DEHCRGAAAERLGAAHRRVDAVRPRDVVRGGDDPPATRIAPDDEGPATQRRILELLDGCEERIQIQVRDDHDDSRVEIGAEPTRSRATSYDYDRRRGKGLLPHPG